MREERLLERIASVGQELHRLLRVLPTEEDLVRYVRYHPHVDPLWIANQWGPVVTMALRRRGKDVTFENVRSFIGDLARHHHQVTSPRTHPFPALPRESEVPVGATPAS